MLQLICITIIVILSSTITGVNGSAYCCICGETEVGTCQEPRAPSNRVYMEGSNNDGEPWTCGGTSHDLLQPGPCGIAQANAFKSGSAGCECPVDNRPVKQEPPCVACPLEDLNILLDGNGIERWFIFTAGALSCSDVMGFALQGFIPESMCDTTINEMAEFGCCGSSSSSTTTTTTPESEPEPEPQACGDNLPDCPTGETCDTRSNTCSDYLARAKRTRSKRLCRKNRGGSRAGC